MLRISLTAILFALALPATATGILATSLRVAGPKAPTTVVMELKNTGDADLHYPSYGAPWVGPSGRLASDRFSVVGGDGKTAHYLAVRADISVMAPDVYEVLPKGSSKTIVVDLGLSYRLEPNTRYTVTPLPILYIDRPLSSFTSTANDVLRPLLRSKEVNSLEIITPPASDPVP